METNILGLNPNIIDKNKSTGYSSPVRYRNEFLKILTYKICNGFKIYGSDRQYVTNLLQSFLEKDFDTMMEEYLNYELREIGRHICKEFGFEEEIKIETGYAVRARLNNHIQAIKQKYNKPKKSRKKKCHDINDLYEQWELELRSCSYNKLEKIFYKSNQWFKVSDELDIPNKTKDYMIHYILSFDPILVDGGLSCFLDEMRKEGLLGHENKK